MSLQREYNTKFYKRMNDSTITASSYSSAKEIVPYVLELLPDTKSVIDLGGAIGTWAGVFKEYNVPDIKVVDGNWVDKSLLIIEEDEFENFDFSCGELYKSEKKYDLAMSLETAEHIDEKYANLFVDSLCGLSDIIMFGAAVENMGGTHHVNEQYQSYWKEKFEKRGYIAIDPIRGMFWDNPRVLPEYAEDTLLYVKKGTVCPNLEKFFGIPFVVDLKSVKMLRLKATNSWEFIFKTQYYVIRATFRKIRKAIFH